MFQRIAYSATRGRESSGETDGKKVAAQADEFYRRCADAKGDGALATELYLAAEQLHVGNRLQAKATAKAMAMAPHQGAKAKETSRLGRSGILSRCTL